MKGVVLKEQTVPSLFSGFLPGDALSPPSYLLCGPHQSRMEPSTMLMDHQNFELNKELFFIKYPASSTLV
jgi:hypothetical protein